MRNRIINGAMVIDQRNAGAAVTAEAYLVDRWRVWRNQTYSIQQVTDAPTGFSNSLRVTKTNTTQSTYGYLIQYIEGFNFADMMFGTANAKTVTISFWVKSSVTGTFTAGIGNSAPSTRFYPASYVINSANIWEQKSITIAGDTTGTWAGATNGVGASVYFNFGSTGTATLNSWQAGDVQVASAAGANLGTTNGATFFLTGVQLEVGTQATSFEYRQYGTELALCQRYYWQSFDGQTPSGTDVIGTSGIQGIVSTGLINGTVGILPSEMRVNGTTTVYDWNYTAGKVMRFDPNSANNSNQDGAAGVRFRRWLFMFSISGANASQVGAFVETDAEL
jgi:hypothetical protein